MYFLVDTERLQRNSTADHGTTAASPGVLTININIILILLQDD